MQKLLDDGKAEEAWHAIQALPGRMRFSSRYLELRLSCARALGWERRAAMILCALATGSGSGEAAPFFSGDGER